MNDTTLMFVKVRNSQYTTAVNLCCFTGLERNELGHVHYFPYVLLSSRQAVSQYSSSLHNDANFLDFSPGKHAVAMGLFFYHTLMSIILVWAPHFISTTSSLETVPMLNGGSAYSPYNVNQIPLTSDPMLAALLSDLKIQIPLS